MTDTTQLDEIRARLLRAALPDIAFDGWQPEILGRAVEQAGVDPNAGLLAFPKGMDDMLAYFFHEGDRSMQMHLAAAPMPERIREKIAAAVKSRLLVDQDNREALRRAMAALALPGRASLAIKLTYQTTDLIWRWAGDQSTDYNFYSKRALLASIIGSTRLVFISDDSDDFARSWDFLDRRIENVMQFEKLKASQTGRLAQASAFLQDVIGTVARRRYASDQHVASSD